VWCDPDWDEITWANEDLPTPGMEHELFNGKGKVLWVWRLKTQQNYQDGIRIEIENDDSFVIEVISIASGLAIYKPVRISEQIESPDQKPALRISGRCS